MPRPVVVVAHDAGGAEILSSGIRRGVFAGGDDTRLVLDGPARAVFERKLGRVKVWSLAQALDGAASVLAGTGWQSMLEFEALAAGAAHGLPTVAVLDHWVNYPERFVRAGRHVRPDALWVGDAEAQALARRTLPGIPVTLVPNPYFAELRDELHALAARAPARGGRGLRVLWVCEPVREPALRQFGNERHWGYVEEEALAFALDQLPRLGPIERVLVRPHPSEAPDKYDAQLAGRPFRLERGGTRPLLAEIADSDVVVGCNSVAMVVGLLAGKRVYSAIPPGGGACRLPQPEIRLLRELVPEAA